MLRINPHAKFDVSVFLVYNSSPTPPPRVKCVCQIVCAKLGFKIAKLKAYSRENDVIKITSMKVDSSLKKSKIITWIKKSDWA